MGDDERGFDDGLWSQLVELGWTGILVPEEQGGLGLDLVDAVVVLEEMGRVPFPGPYFSSAIEATIAARRLGAFDLLEGLADGSKRGTIALDELGHGDPVDRIRTRARRKGAEWVLSGLKPLVLDGHTADWVIVAARTQEGIGSFLIESPAAEYVPTMDPTRKAARLVLDETPAIPLGPLGDHQAIWRRIADDATVGLAAELVGVCEAALEMAVEYSKVRVQFDKPIATHQVIQHKIVDMLHKLELGRVGVHFAAWSLGRRGRAPVACGGDREELDGRRCGVRHRGEHPGARRRRLHLGLATPSSSTSGRSRTTRCSGTRVGSASASPTSSSTPPDPRLAATFSAR